MKKYLVIAALIGLLIVAAVLIWPGKSEAPIQSPTGAEAGYKDAAYIIEGQPVKLVDGRSAIAIAPGSASEIVTQYFGNEAAGDLNGDGVPDVAFILTQTTGGSGTFYYVVAALKTATGYQGTNAVLLGDRIAPQTTEIANDRIVVNYADRAKGEPMSTAPSLGISKYLTITGTTLAESPTTALK